MVGYINTKNDAVWELLRRLAPPEGIFASGPVHSALSFLGETLGAEQIAISDPDLARAQMSKKVFGGSNEIVALEFSIDSESRTRLFYDLSIKAESGFIPSDRLTPLWQNISEKGSREVATQSLSEALANLEFKSNWLALNRLDSITLLEQIEQWPYRPDVLLIRALNETAPQDAEELSNVSKLETLLRPQNYRLITKISETHPHICQCVFLADWQKQTEAKSTELAEAKKAHSLELENLNAKIAATEKQVDANKQNALLAESNLADLRRQHEALSQTYIEQCSQVSEIKSLLGHLSALAADEQ